MGWSDVDLKGVSTQFELIPPGRYTFQVQGAKPSKFDAEAIEVRAVITSEGEQQGRVIFFRYSNPDVWKSSPKALKRLLEATGTEVTNGETPLEVLNRAAKDGAKFSGEIIDRPYPNKETGEMTPNTELKLFSVGVAN